MPGRLVKAARCGAGSESCPPCALRKHALRARVLGFRMRLEIYGLSFEFELDRSSQGSLGFQSDQNSGVGDVGVELLMHKVSL